MPHYAIAEERRASELKFVERIYRMRMLGTALSMLPIASVLEERSAPAWAWALLLLNAFAWPQVAVRLGRRARRPVATEFRCLMLDSGFGGAWIAAMAVSAGPSAVLLTALSADKIAAGGALLLGRASLVLLIGFAATWWALGFPFEPVASQRTLVATLPFLFLYSVALSMLNHRLGRRIADQNRALERLNRTDSLIQLPNRRHFESRAQHEFLRYRRTGRPITLVLIDVDRFKEVNDRYGHGMGDRVLERVARILERTVRDIDMPARYGGDEFAMLLVDTGGEDAARIAERARDLVRGMRFDDHPDLCCSLSIGIAELTDDVHTLEQWMSAADAALYRAKAAGRDRIERA
ncbi:diguanylate cyclase [Luteimonas sp. Y-2-2-4F]|nr:diguanylate cyclase [Luteimonas sp. Y-2-2-4F]